MNRQGLTRRDFLKLQLVGIMGAAVVPGVLGTGRVSAQEIPDLAVVNGSPGPATRAAVELLGGMKQFVKPGQKVIIKPNMSFSTPPERASNTHPVLVVRFEARTPERLQAIQREIFAKLREYPFVTLPSEG